MMSMSKICEQDPMEKILEQARMGELDPSAEFLSYYPHFYAFVSNIPFQQTQLKLPCPCSPVPKSPDIRPHPTVMDHLACRREFVNEKSTSAINKYPYFEIVLTATCQSVKQHLSDLLLKTQQELVIDEQFTIGKYSPSDNFLFLLSVLKQQQQTPYLLLEYKQSLCASLEGVDGHHLSQLALRSYYVVKEFKLASIVSCLSDGVTWHFIKFNTTSLESSLLEMEWGKTIITLEIIDVVEFLGRHLYGFITDKQAS